MRNIKLTIQYDGTRYSGWQFQKNARSIQEVIQKAIKKITGECVNLIASGRTDAGVHAKSQVANFKTTSKLPAKNIHMALNGVLPEDIVIFHAEEADPGFNAQHMARSKIYRYTIINSNFNDPFLRKFAAKCFYRLDLKVMRRAARLLEGKHDFRAFKTVDGPEKSCVRTIKSIAIAKDQNVVYIDIKASGFLYNMARNIVGTLIEVGRGKIDLGKVKYILQKKDRRLCGPTMPAKGLCLMKVRY